jgi:Uma2 family endonuclease
VIYPQLGTGPSTISTQVTIAQSAARNPHRYQSHEVALAIEIVSTGSVTMDRVTKPALYAQAEIPFYWRIETEDGIVVHTHVLDPVAEIYRPTGSFDQVVEVDQPWALSLPIASFTPRRLNLS